MHTCAHMFLYTCVCECVFTCVYRWVDSALEDIFSSMAHSSTSPQPIGLRDGLRSPVGGFLYGRGPLSSVAVRAIAAPC